MKTDREKLLEDVLAEAAPPDFREALLGESVRLVRRRRLCRARNVAAMVALLGVLGIFVWPKRPASSPIALAPQVVPIAPAPHPLPLVSAPIVPTPSAPALAYTLIDSQPFSTASIITTQPFGSVPALDSAATVAIVQTTFGNYHDIGDEQLLALTSDHPALLVHLGPHSEKLIFANPADAQGFPAN